RGVGPDLAAKTLHHRAAYGALRRRIADDPQLSSLDERAVDGDFEALRQLIEARRGRVLAAVRSRWTALQQDRLLALTGTKLNGLGASVRQRLFVRGRRAMKLRQVVRVGRSLDPTDGGGDPLFDLCPVWMCSPETVAQIFPLDPIFDVVIFDEASQCRLEEALPVLVRAHRVVIAGDPEQLPPSRFFEASVASSEVTDIETEDDLFEAQQTDVEDVLAAALQLDVQECYLDVHYRSRHRTLIEFSNEHFYGNRLQALPGHPEDLAEIPPIQFRQVSGIYEKRRNRAEAEAVVEIVDELLRRDDPPSLGVATFNLVQKDLVSDLLAEKAELDADFRRRYDAARGLFRDGGFEGLFVKNLENVQGDERDHIIISTTYGVNEAGRFYRRFGPLGARGGGRRLNVLVTRARRRLHLVTSIPPSVYRAGQALPAGGEPSGAWLLLAYLRFAEDAVFPGPVSGGRGADPDPARNRVEEARIDALDVRSPLVDAVAGRLDGAAGEVTVGRYWGNDGFCVDVTARRGGERRRGLLLDFARYRRAPDAVEWDLFATELLRAQGWELRRNFSPRLFRDADRLLDDFLRGDRGAGRPEPRS
ncbi:MAG: DEAD/DEAH box helicase, partial [Acidobacteriota bacterium]